MRAGTRVGPCPTHTWGNSDRVLLSLGQLAFLRRDALVDTLPSLIQAPERGRAAKRRERATDGIGTDQTGPGE